MNVISLRTGSYERSRRIQYLKEQIAYLGELPCAKSVIERKNALMGELETIQEVDSERINELSDL